MLETQNMKKILFLLVLVFKISISQDCNDTHFERICYYSAWSGSIQNMISNPHLCSIIIYTYAKIENGILTGLWSNPLSELKLHNRNLKVMIGVGGWRYLKIT